MFLKQSKVKVVQACALVINDFTGWPIQIVNLFFFFFFFFFFLVFFFLFVIKFKGKQKAFNRASFLFGKVGQWGGLVNNKFPFHSF